MIRSPTKRPGQGGTTLVSDSGPPLRPEGLTSDSGPPLQPEGLANNASNSDPRLRLGIHRTSAYSFSPTGVVGADWDQPTGDARSVRTQEMGRKVRQGAQVNRNTKDCTLNIRSTVLTGHVRRVPCHLLGMSEPKQCCGRRRLPYSVVGAINSHTR